MDAFVEPYAQQIYLRVYCLIEVKEITKGLDPESEEKLNKCCTIIGEVDKGTAKTIANESNDNLDFSYILQINNQDYLFVKWELKKIF